MTPYEQMVKFEIGLEIGLLNLDELKAFLSKNLSQLDVPYIYTDVFLSIPNGHDAVINTIFYNLHNEYQMDCSAGNNVQRMLIGIIHDKYDSGEIDLEQCVGFLHALTNYSECCWELLSIDEYYKLMQSGYCSEVEFDAMLNKIFSMELK